MGTCDYWDGGYWGTCATLESRYGCDCSGCTCDGCPQGDCDEPKFDVAQCLTMALPLNSRPKMTTRGIPGVFFDETTAGTSSTVRNFSSNVREHSLNMLRHIREVGAHTGNARSRGMRCATPRTTRRSATGTVGTAARAPASGRSAGRMGSRARRRATRTGSPRCRRSQKGHQ